MSVITKDLGAVSAYAYAVEKGYTGTEAEFAELMASYATVGQTAVTAAQTATTKASEAATSATTATNKASEATTAAQTATTKAQEAVANAEAAARDASQAMAAESMATAKASEATTAAATATSAKTDAVAANTAAQSAKTAAQTAQTGAETAAASVQSSAAQIATNTEDITQLKEDLKQISPSVITEYSGSTYVTTANNYYRKLNLAPLSGKTYVVKITATTAGNHTFQIGTTASASGVRDTLGTFTMGAGESRYVYGYTPSGSGYIYCRNTAGDDWNIVFYEIYENLSEDAIYAKNVAENVSDSGILYDGVTFFQDSGVGPSGVLIESAGKVLWFPRIVYKSGTVFSVSDKTKYQMYIRMWTDTISSSTVTDVTWTSDDYTLQSDVYVAVTLAYKAGVSGSITVAEANTAFFVTLTENVQKGLHERIAVNENAGSKNSNDIMDIFGNLTEIGTGGYVKGINHRGYNSEAPQNTIPAFIMSRKKGFKYVETDVRYTSDGVPVLLHDFEINYVARNADGTELSETVYIADITYEQALQYVFCGNFYAQYPTQRITTFRDFIVLCRNIGLHPYIELKSSAYNPSVLVDIVRDCGMLENVTWTSFGNSLLSLVKTADANARLGYTVTDVTETAITQTLALKTDTNKVFISASSDSANNISLCRTAGIPMEVYTLNSVASIVDTDPYVSGVTSDTLNATAVLYQNAMAKA